MKHILLIFFSMMLITSVVAQTLTPKDKVLAAKKSSLKARKKLNLNNSFFTNLEADENLSTGELTLAAVKEHDSVFTCLQSDQLKRKQKRWLNQYLKIIDKLWDQESYFGLDNPHYIVNETSLLVGKSAYMVDLVHDANDPNLIYIKNFYNLGTKFQLPVVQIGKQLIIKNQTIDGYQVTGIGHISADGKLEIEVELFDGNDRDKCQMQFSELGK